MIFFFLLVLTNCTFSFGDIKMQHKFKPDTSTPPAPNKDNTEIQGINKKSAQQL